MTDFVAAAADARGSGALNSVLAPVAELSSLPRRVLSDPRPKGRERRTRQRMHLYEAGELPDEDTGDRPASSGRRRKVAEQEKLAGRVQRHLLNGSVSKAARALEAAPLADASLPEVMNSLRKLHPEAAPAEPLDVDLPALQVSGDDLKKVMDGLGKFHRGSAGGPSGWTFEMVMAVAQSTEDGFNAVLAFVNLILSGELPRCGELLDSLLLGLQKPAGGVRPIAVGEVWYRLAGLCALEVVGREAGNSLAPLQVGCGTRGGVDAVAHGVATALAADPQNVLLTVDMQNAFNRVDRAAVYAAVKQRVPELLPVVQWAYGAPSLLHVVGAAEGAPPLESQRGVKQGDPLGPLLFSLALQGPLERLDAAVPNAPKVAYLDDFSAVGRPEAIRSIYGRLVGDGPESAGSIGLTAVPTKSALYGADEAACSVLSHQIGVPYRRDGVVVVGVPLGTPDFVRDWVQGRADKVAGLTHKVAELPLPKQSQLLILRLSLAARMLHLQRTVDWELLAPATRRVEDGLVTAAARIFRLPTGEGPAGCAPVASPKVAQLLLPVRHGGFGLRVTSQVEAKAAFLAGAATAQRVMAEGPSEFRPFDGPARPALLQRWHDVLDSCGGAEGLSAADRDLPAKCVRETLPRLQAVVSRYVGDQEGKAFFDACDTDTAAGVHDAQRIRSERGGPASAFLAATPGQATTMGDNAFVSSGRHRLGLGVHCVAETPLCACAAGLAGSPDHAMVCTQVARMRTLRHDQVAYAVRRIIQASGCNSSMEPPYRRFRGSDQQGVGNEGMHRGDILCILPDGSMLIIDVVITHPGAPTYAQRAARVDGYAAKRAAQEKTRDFEKFADGAQYGFVPFAVESYGRLGTEAIEFIKTLGDAAAAGGRISKSAFVANAYKVLSCALQKGNGNVYAQSLAAVARANGRSFMPGCEVAVQDASDVL